MFTYKFFVAPTGMLALQLLGNYKKSQLSLKIRVSGDILALAQSHKKRGENSVVSELRAKLRTYEIFLEKLQKRIPEGGRRTLDVKNIRTELGWSHFQNFSFKIWKTEENNVNLQL